MGMATLIMDYVSQEGTVETYCIFQAGTNSSLQLLQ